MLIFIESKNSPVILEIEEEILVTRIMEISSINMLQTNGIIINSSLGPQGERCSQNSALDEDIHSEKPYNNRF